jgi:hypothetical protein
MRVASSQPHPYLLNQAGGICKVKEFILKNGQLDVVPLSDKPVTGQYHLIYRDPDHQHSDVKRAVRSDGSHWSVAERLPADEDCDVCYPGPSD